MNALLRLQFLVSPIYVSSISVSLALLSGCNGVPEKPAYDHIERYGYTAMVPPRSDRNAGWTFHVAKEMNGRETASTVCRNIIPDLVPPPGSLTLSKVRDTSSNSFESRLSIVEKLIKSPIDANAALEVADEITIDWKDVQSYEIANEDWFSQEGQPKAIADQCYAAINDLKAKGELENVFVLQSVVIANSAEFKLVEKNNISGGISADWKKLVSGSLSASVSSEDNTTLSFSEPRTIGFIAFRIKEWVPTGLVGRVSANVKLEQLSTQEAAKLPLPAN